MLKSIPKPFLLSWCCRQDIEVGVVGLAVITSVISESRILGYTRITYNPMFVDDNCRKTGIRIKLLNFVLRKIENRISAFPQRFTDDEQNCYDASLICITVFFCTIIIIDSC